jgi:hypothetical protein
MVRIITLLGHRRSLLRAQTRVAQAIGELSARVHNACIRHTQTEELFHCNRELALHDGIACCSRPIQARWVVAIPACARDVPRS